MTNSRYLSMMDLGRTDMVIRTGMGKFAFKHKWLGIAGASTIRWRKELNIFDKITVETKILGWDDKWFYVEQRLVSGGIVRSIAIIRVTFYKKGGIVPCRKVVDIVEPGLKSPKFPHTIKLWIELEDEMRNRLKDESERN
jgi:acyl-CoA thioesterase FadM